MSNITIHTPATDIAAYAAILPDGWVDAHVIEPEPVNDGTGYGDCPICGCHCDDADKGKTWRHVVNVINDHKKERRYHFDCLLHETERANALKNVEGKHTKVGDGHEYVVTFIPLEGKENAELAAAMMTPNRQAENNDMSGAWFYLPENDGGGYISPRMRNLKWQSRLGTAARTCTAAIVNLEIYLDGCWAETVTFSWRSRDERGKWVSSDNNKHGFLVLVDWEVGKYRKRGLQQYNYKENIERAKLERDYGVRGRKRFWL